MVKIEDLVGKVFEAPRVSLDSSKITYGENGEMIVSAKIMKAGWLNYRPAEGPSYRTYISKDELKKMVDRQSMDMKPLTLRHPPELLNPGNVARFAKGTTSTGASFDGEWVNGKLVVTDKQAQTEVEKYPGISAGYTWDVGKIIQRGESFDIFIEDIKINHVALAARTPRNKGAGVSFDEEETDIIKLAGCSFDEDDQSLPQHEPKETMKVKQTIPSVSVRGISYDEFKLEYDEKDQASIDPLIAREAKFRGDLEGAGKSLDEAEGKIKSLEAELETEKKKTEGMIPAQSLDEEVAKHLAHKEELAKWQTFAKAENVSFDETSTDPLTQVAALKKAMVEKAYPNVSFDEGQIEGAALVLIEQRFNAQNPDRGLAQKAKADIQKQLMPTGPMSLDEAGTSGSMASQL